MVTSRCRTQPRTHISSLIAWPLLGQAPRRLIGQCEGCACHYDFGFLCRFTPILVGLSI